MAPPPPRCAGGGRARISASSFQDCFLSVARLPERRLCPRAPMMGAGGVAPCAVACLLNWRLAPAWSHDGDGGVALSATDLYERGVSGVGTRTAFRLTETAAQPRACLHSPPSPQNPRTARIARAHMCFNRQGGRRDSADCDCALLELLTANALALLLVLLVVLLY